MFCYRRISGRLIVAIGVLLVSIFLNSCFDKATSSDTAKVKFEHPNSESILSNTNSIEVLVIYPDGDSVLIYKGSSLDGPWEGTINKSDLELLIVQLDSSGLDIKSDSYFYVFQNGTLKIESKLELNPKTLELMEGGQPFQVNAKLFPSHLDLAISWMSSDESIASVTSQGVVDPSSPGEVFIIASAGENLKDTVLVHVKTNTNGLNGIKIIAPLQNQMAYETDSVRFTIVVEGKGIGYKWYLDGELQNTELGPSFLIPNVEIDMDEVEVAVEISNGDTTITSTAILNVLNPSNPLVFLQTIPDTAVSIGMEFFVKASVNKIEGLSFSWKKGEQEISDSSSMWLSELAESDTGLYIVTVNWKTETIVDSFIVSINSDVTHAIAVTTTGKGKVTYEGDTVSVLNVNETQGAVFEFLPDSGYQIEDVLVDEISNEEAIAAASYSFSNVNSSHTLEVVFSKISLSLDFATMPASGSPGTPVAIPETIHWGDTIEIRATPDSSQGWEFDYWEISNISTGQMNYVSNSDSSMETAQIVITKGDINLVAHYLLKQLTVNFDIGDHGSHTSGGALKQTIAYGTGAKAPVVTPHEGWVFDGWDVDFSNVTSDLSITAKYVRLRYSVTVSAGTGGVVNPSGLSSVEYGSSLTISATPEDGYEFVKWTANRGIVIENPNSSTTSISNITSGSTVTAHFWICGDDIVEDRPNLLITSYSTFSNGNQCWLGENLNAGKFLSAVNSPQNSENGDIEKYCFDNLTENCLTNGGIYTWLEAMQGATTERAQGVCPNGWHIPDSTEFQSLIDSGVDMAWDIMGYVEFNAGSLDYGTFYDQAQFGGYWTSSNYSMARRSTTGDISISSSSDIFGVNVRCIKDP